MTIRPRRSVLYMPGSNARAIEKARTLAADAIILDLEDSVAPDSKAAARQQVADAALKRFGTAETYAWAAQLKLNNGDRSGGLNLLRQAQVKDPSNIGLRLTYASLLGQSGQYAQASHLLEKGPQNAQTYAMRAALATISGVCFKPVKITSMPASRRAWAMTVTPTVCVSMPSLASRTRIGRLANVGIDSDPA